MHSLRSILVHMDSSSRCRARLMAARALALAHEATVTAVLAEAIELVDTPYSYSAGAVAGDEMEALSMSRGAGARAMFDAVLDMQPQAAFVELPAGSPAWAVARLACCADLLLLGQPDPGSRASARLPADFVPAVIAASGRPALVWPASGRFEQPADTALVAWTHTPASARALAGALPLLRKARRVHVVSWAEEPLPAAGALDVGAYLALHGVTATVQRHARAPQRIGPALLALCTDIDAQLLVMGCYGHSRAQELLLGGTTRDMLRAMTVPVLMAH